LIDASVYIYIWIYALLMVSNQIHLPLIFKR